MQPLLLQHDEAVPLLLTSVCTVYMSAGMLDLQV